MTYNEKKSLYESIMRDVAKTVKSRITRLDESESNPFTRRVQELLDREDEISSFSKATLMSVIDCVLSYENSGSEEKKRCVRKIGDAAAIRY